MTKLQIMDCLNEIGFRFVREGAEDERTHYRNLGIAFGVAVAYLGSLPAPQVEAMADVIEQLGLAGGSVQ